MTGNPKNGTQQLVMGEPSNLPNSPPIPSFSPEDILRTSVRSWPEATHEIDLATIYDVSSESTRRSIGSEVFAVELAQRTLGGISPLTPDWQLEEMHLLRRLGRWLRSKPLGVF